MLMHDGYYRGVQYGDVWDTIGNVLEAGVTAAGQVLPSILGGGHTTPAPTPTVVTPTAQPAAPMIIAGQKISPTMLVGGLGALGLVAYLATRKGRR